jgi:DNA polymerase III subunit chi
MTERVDFYVLKSAAQKPRLTVACRLAQMAYLRDLRVIVWSDDAAEAKMLDELLWTFTEDSFVPHQLCARDQSPAPDVPVSVTSSLDAVAAADLLINMSARLPAQVERFGRVAEIIDADPERRRLGRERFKSYRDLKLPLETHQVE